MFFKLAMSEVLRTSRGEHFPIYQMHTEELVDYPPIFKRLYFSLGKPFFPGGKQLVGEIRN